MSFYRTELRVMQDSCDGDNEKFLNMIAAKLQADSDKIEKLERELGMSQHTLRKLEADELARWDN